MSARPLTFSPPAAQGADASGIHAFLDGLEASPEIEPHSLMIMRHGQARRRWLVGAVHPRPCPSAVLAQQELHLHGRRASLRGGPAAAGRHGDLVLPELDQGITDLAQPRDAGAARRVHGHRAHRRDPRPGGSGPGEPGPWLPAGAPDREPGTVFAYNQPATYTLGAIVRRVTGQSLTDYLRAPAFRPARHRRGGLAARPVRRGAGLAAGRTSPPTPSPGWACCTWRWRVGRRPLLPEEWVSQATRVQIANADSTDEDAWPDWQQGYGFQFWMSRHGYRGDGAYGQFLRRAAGPGCRDRADRADPGHAGHPRLAWSICCPLSDPARCPAGRPPTPPSPSGWPAWPGRRPQASRRPAGPGRGLVRAEFTPYGGRCSDQPGLASAASRRRPTARP